MRILEIGAGKEAGPFFEDVTEHIIVDTAAEKLAVSLQTDNRFTPMVADAANLPDIDDESIDIVLARNVFGDPNLGMDTNEYIRLKFYSTYGAQVETDIVDKKRAIMNEAARVLLRNGSLLIVEQYTPSVAREFLSDLALHGANPQSLSFPMPVELEAVTPANYAKFMRRRANSVTWMSKKRF